jgi:DNA primase
MRKFGLGYAMNSWDGLIKVAERERIDIVTLEKAGLALKREDAGGYYDRFRGRAVFPFSSTSGRTVGFGARKLREDDPLGKYMNSPETLIYDKSRILYGIFQSKDAIREKEFAVLVEGYIDLISLFQAGVENVVATSGTALTEGQIQLIGRYAKNITLAYDADSAGSKASIRGVDLIMENGLDVKIAELPSGEDPDSCVKKNGGAAFKRLVENAVTFLDFKVMLFQAEGLFDTPDGQTRAVRSIVETISKMKDELKRSFYIKRVSEKYGIYETVLYRELEKLIGQARARGQFMPRSNVDVGIQKRGSVQQSQSRGLDIPAPERDLIKLMLEYGNEMVMFVITNFEPTMFTSQQAQQVIRLLVRHTEGGDKWDANSLINEVENAELKHLIANLLFSEFEISKGWAEIDSMPETANAWEVAERCIAKLRMQKIDALMAENQSRMKEAEVRGEVLTEYHERNNTLNREKSEIRSGHLLERRELQ